MREVEQRVLAARAELDAALAAMRERPEPEPEPPTPEPEPPVNDTVRVSVNGASRDVPLGDNVVFGSAVRVYATREPGGCAVVVTRAVGGDGYLDLHVSADNGALAADAQRSLYPGDAIILPLVMLAARPKASWVGEMCHRALRSLPTDKLWPDAGYNAPAGHGIGPSCFRWQIALGGGPGTVLAYEALARQAWPTIWRPTYSGQPTVATVTRYWQGRQTGQLAGWGGEDAKRDRWAPDAEHFSRLYAPAVALLDAGIDSGLARLVLAFAWADVKSDWSLHPDYPRVTDPNSGVLWAGLAQAIELARTAAFRPPAGNPWMNRGFWHRVRVLEAVAKHGIVGEDEAAEYAAGYLQLAAALTDRRSIQNRTAPGDPSPGDIGQFWSPPHNLQGSLTSVWQQMLVDDGLRRLERLPGGEGAATLRSDMDLDGPPWPYALDGMDATAGTMPGGWNYPAATQWGELPDDLKAQAQAADALVNPLDWVSDAEFEDAMADMAD